MSTEIELSLSLSPSQNAEFKRKVAKLLPQASKPVEQPLVSIYYDTPALDLAKRRMGLRVVAQWSGDGTLAEMENTPNVKLNLLHC